MSLAKSPLQQFPFPGKDAEDLGIGPGNMPEKGCCQVASQRLQVQGRPAEVVVLEKDQASGFGGIGHRLGELAVDGVIGFPVRGKELGADIAGMAERPKGLVGKTLVIALFLPPGQGKALETVAFDPRGDPDRSVRCGDLKISLGAAMADPKPSGTPGRRNPGRWSAPRRCGLARWNRPAKHGHRAPGWKRGLICGL